MSEVVSLAFQACREQRILRITYVTGEGNKTVRDIDVYWVDHCHLDAVCRLRKDLRHFRMDRIHAAELLPETFERDPELAVLLKYGGLAAPREGIPKLPGPRRPLAGAPREEKV